jgi:hypothetical protein
VTEFDPLDRLEAELRSLRPPGLSPAARARIDARLRRDRLARSWPLAAAAAVIAIGLTALLWRARLAPDPGSHPSMAHGDQPAPPPDPRGKLAPEAPPLRMAEAPHPSSLWALRAALGDPEHDLDALLARRAAEAPPARDSVPTPLGRGLELGLLQ